MFGTLSLICDFQELYRYLIDDFVVDYARKLTPKDFILKAEDYSSNRKGKRQYLNDKMQREFFKNVNSYFRAKVSIPRIRRGEKQEIETLINEEALLFAKCLRNEKAEWVPDSRSLNY
jgi:CRISPR/Cas system-associated endonuclease Cas1